MVMEPQQASPMSKINGARLPSTPWSFWTCISTSGNLCLIKNCSKRSSVLLCTVFTRNFYEKDVK